MNKGASYWKSWIKAAGVRAIKTVAQTAVATIGSSAVLGEVMAAQRLEKGGQKAGAQRRPVGASA